MSKPIYRQGTCAYCGNVGNVTADHVIPQCLWPGRVPKTAPIVDSCLICNNVWKSGYDTYLRDVLVIDMSSSRSPITQKLLPKYNRAHVRNQSKLTRDMQTNYEYVGLVRPSGIIGSFATTSRKIDKQIQIIMSMIVRGLFHYYIHDILPSDVSFDVARLIDQQLIEKILRGLNERGGSYACIGSGDVFECVFGSVAEKNHVSVWVLNFYRRVLFAVFTGIPKSDIIVVR